MDKQKEILAAALKLFVEFGFHGTPTSKIAKEAGVANGTLFHYFNTKDDLILALYLDIKTRLTICSKFETLKGETIKARCKRYYVSILYWALENKNEFQYIQQFLSSPFISLVSIEEHQKHTKASYELIQEGIDAEIIKSLPIDYIFILISSHIYGVNQYLLTTNFTLEEQKSLIESSFDLLWDMIT